jgi:preprotein translocase subunit SecD
MTSIHLEEIMASQSNPAKESNQAKSLSKFIFIVAGVFVVICGLVALLVFYRFARLSSEPKTQIILEPDYSVVSTVNPSDLKNAAEILTARCNGLGVRASFEVTENKQIVAQVPKSIDVEPCVRSTIGIWLVEYVDFGKTPITPGTTIATDLDFQYFPPAEGTKWHTLITNREIKTAYVEQNNSGQYQVPFLLTSDGTKILADYTTNNVGHYLGIVIDKVVVTAPIVNSPITDGSGIIAGFTQEEANYLAVQLYTKGPLPIPLKLIEVR